VSRISYGVSNCRLKHQKFATSDWEEGCSIGLEVKELWTILMALVLNADNIEKLQQL
jgi:hypothetical protein